MAAVTAQMVKALREQTGAGMMDCKKALNETDGVLDDAIDWLRTKGLSAAAKKSGRVAAEGVVAFSVSGSGGALIEVNSETDFVSRNGDFQDFSLTLAGMVLENGDDVEHLKAQSYPTTSRTVEEQLTHNIATIGENMSIRRATKLDADGGVVIPYMHNSVAPGLGKIGVLVVLKSDAPVDKLSALGKQIAMHVAATAPQSLRINDLDPAVIERERVVLTDQAKESGRPENIVEKMVSGRLQKFYQEVVLLEQTFVIDNETKISSVIEDASKEFGSSVELISFCRLSLGEGIEKESTDFASEVAATLGN
jgi:elongation factor Ts